jgi:hypothetical protein
MIIVNYSAVFAQDTIEFPQQMVPDFLQMKASLAEPTIKFPIIENNQPQFDQNFKEIKSIAYKIKDSLQLNYIEYYSEKNSKWDSINDFKNYFSVNSNFLSHINISQNELNFEIDTINNSTIFLRQLPKFESGINFFYGKNNVTAERTIKTDSTHQIDKLGTINVKIKYLAAYDTLILNKNHIEQDFQIGKSNFRLKNILNGDLYITPLDSILHDDILKNLKFVALRENKIIHETKQQSSLGNFSSITSYSKFLNDRLTKLSKNEYEEYLRNLQLYKNDIKTDLIVLMTNLDYDEIILLLPKFDILSTEIKSSIKKQNIDNLEIVRISVPLKESSNLENENID